MARSRNIKPGFFKNEVLAELPMETRMLFVGLWTLADREGRMEDRPKRIKMELFAYDSFDVDPMLNQLQVDGFLTRYESNGVRYIQIENFVKHQDPHYKEKVSEIPAPDGVEDIIKATAVTRGQRARILERDEYRCQSCSAESHLCIDRIIPASRGGDSSDDNLQVLCNSCNTKKGNRLDGEERGVKKSQHNPSAVIVRHNVDPTLNQRILPSPSDSLIPDSRFLIPDTKGESASHQPPAKRAAPTKPEPFEIPEWVNPEHWATWHSCPKRRKATNEQKQLAVNKLDAWRLAGQDFAGALENAAMGGYQGLFLPDKPRVNPGGETVYQRAMREKMEVMAPAIAAKAPGVPRTNPNNFFDALPNAKPLEITQ